MTKIYEALDNASKERADVTPKRSIMPGTTLPRGLVDKLLSLYQRLETLMGEQRCGVAAIAGAQTGDDSAKLTCELAKLAAGRLRRRILLVSAGSAKGMSQLVPANATGWEEMAQDGVVREELFKQYGDTSLFVSQMVGGAHSLPSILASPLLPGLFDALRARFDMILIDTPSLESSQDAVQLAALADGAVLVVNAGKTRWQVVKRWMEQIVSRHGQVVGVLFNKRRDYIPHWLYRRL